MDRDANAIAAITMVLRSLHDHGKVDDQAVTVVLDLGNKVKIAKAGADLQPGALQLPPCIPASGKIHTTSTHPYRVAINVTQRTEERSVVLPRDPKLARLRQSHKTGPEPEDDVPSFSSTFYAHPEYTLPVDATPEVTLPDGGTSEDAVAVAAGVASESLWTWTGKESLHPYWAIERLTQDGLDKKNLGAISKFTFNVKTKWKPFRVVTVGELNGESVAMTVTVSLPLITNEGAIAQGAELLMEVVSKAPEGQKRKTSIWKDDLVIAAQAKVKAAKAAAKAKPKGVVITSEV